MNEQELKELIDKYLAEAATPEEEERLLQWYHAMDDREETVTFASRAEKELLFRRVRERLSRYALTGSTELPRRRSVTRKIYRVAVAASFLLLLGAGIYYIVARRPAGQQVVQQQAEADIAPGGSRATLTLSDGSTVVLTGAKNGTLAQQGAMLVNKTADGQVVYAAGAGQQPSAAVLNTITTPAGGVFHLTLADGTRVSLNAGSSITYPVVFNGRSREVSVTGEAYFEVVHNARQPFRVKAGGQVIEDIGTAFNVNAYTDEPAMVTTLSEGAIKIGGAALRPGQQAIVKDGSIRVAAADVAQALAWKNGYFAFHNTTLREVMRQLARWYDVEVVYEGSVPDLNIGGGITRNTNLSQVLAILKQLDIHFKIQNKKIIVMP